MKPTPYQALESCARRSGGLQAKLIVKSQSLFWVFQAKKVQEIGQTQIKSSIRLGRSMQI